MKNKLNVAETMLLLTNPRCVWVGLTWSVRLQVPGAPGAPRLDGGGLRGVNGTAGLNVPLLVSHCGDLQDWDGGALVQLPGGWQHLGEPLLTHAHSSLQRAAQIYILWAAVTKKCWAISEWMGLLLYVLYTGKVANVADLPWMPSAAASLPALFSLD